MGVLLVLLDAFSNDYLNSEHTPFLVEMAKNGVARPLAPMFAFRGIEATIFTGEWPLVHNVWTEFRLRTKSVNRLSARLLSAGLSLLDNINHEYVSKLARLGVTMISNRCITRLTPSLLPGRFLLYFEPSMRKQIWHPKSLDVNTVFDWLRSRRRGFVCLERIPPLRDDFATARLFERSILRHKPDFAWVKLNFLDNAGHTYGPDISRLKESLSEMDALVEELVECGQKAGLNNVIVMSDHGMSFVKEFQDPEPLLGQLHEDVIFFLDSTMARFWFENQSQKDEVVDMLNPLPYGEIITSQKMAALKAPKDPRYGETIFALDEGHVFCPDFWNWRKKVRGMHGYAYPKSTSAVPFLLSNEGMTSFAPHNDEDFFQFTDITPWVIRALESRFA